jgi:hypothetical protein
VSAPTSLDMIPSNSQCSPGVLSGRRIEGRHYGCARDLRVVAAMMRRRWRTRSRLHQGAAAGPSRSVVATQHAGRRQAGMQMSLITDVFHNNTGRSAISASVAPAGYREISRLSRLEPPAETPNRRPVRSRSRKIAAGNFGGERSSPCQKQGLG